MSKVWYSVDEIHKINGKSTKTIYRRIGEYKDNEKYNKLIRGNRSDGYLLHNDFIKIFITKEKPLEYNYVQEGPKSTPNEITNENYVRLLEQTNKDYREDINDLKGTIQDLIEQQDKITKLLGHNQIKLDQLENKIVDQDTTTLLQPRSHNVKPETKLKGIEEIILQWLDDGWFNSNIEGKGINQTCREIERVTNFKLNHVKKVYGNLKRYGVITGDPNLNQLEQWIISIYDELKECQSQVEMVRYLVNLQQHHIDEPRSFKSIETTLTNLRRYNLID